MNRVLGEALLVVLVVMSAMTGAASAQAPAADPCRYEGGVTDDQGVPYYTGEDPSRHPTLLRPFALVKYPCPRPLELRAALLTPRTLDFVEGGQLVRRLPLPVRTTPVPFEDVAALLEPYSWAAEVEPGVFELSAALVQAPGTTMSVAAPRVKTVRLLDRPGVFIAGNGATARFEGVSITSWDPSRSVPDDNVADHRPFVVYDESSRLDVASSTMSYLGSDRTSAYGVTWGSDSTGEVLGSRFDHNFFGIYTSEAHDISFRKNVFHDNLYYGLNAHTDSTHILTEDNEGFGNGGHGFVYAAGVVDSVLRGNHSHDNKSNGIVMDGASNRNLIERNLIERNGQDGIALIGSSDEVVAENIIRNNRVGVRVNDQGSDRNVLRSNLISGNEIGVQTFGGATETRLVDNTVEASRKTGLLLESPGTEVTGGTVRAANRGIEIRSTAQVADVSVSEVGQGIVVTASGSADVDHVNVAAKGKPVDVRRGGSMRIQRSTLNDPPVEKSWMSLVGIAALSLAVLLHAVSHIRTRHRKEVLAPPGVWNTT